MKSILIIDDEPGIRHLLARMMELEGYEAFQASDRASGLEAVRAHEPQVVLCDVFLPDGNGVDMVGEIKALLPDGEVILLTAHGNIADGVQAIKNGAFDYITKGDDNNKIVPIVSRAIDAVARRDKERPSAAAGPPAYSFGTILGHAAPLQAAVRLAGKVAATDVPVLLTGETGTGKEVFAHAIHQGSLRSQGPFMAVNCSAFSRELLESELFGHRAGSFTGAMKDKKGLFEEANRGTLFLDEVGEMDYSLQAKLLRVLETGEYLKIGDTRPTRIDVRIISATNRDLKQEIADSHFRSDLFFRLSVFSLHLPSLRERRDDVPELAQAFAKRFAAQLGRPDTGFSAAAMAALQAYAWPGNVRELRNVVERALIVCDDKVDVPDLPIDIQTEAAQPGATPNEFELAAMERTHITRVLQHTGGNKTEAARLLKIGLTTLYRKIEEYKIQP